MKSPNHPDDFFSLHLFICVKKKRIGQNRFVNQCDRKENKGEVNLIYICSRE
jgi:hypothetical protein